MKLTLLKQRLLVCYLYSGLLVLTVCILLVSASPAQLGKTMIAFASDRNWDWNVDVGKVNIEIYLMNPDGEQIRQLTEAPGYDEGPAWSPAGQKITFVSHRDQVQLIAEDEVFRGEIYVINVDGTNPINLTQSLEKPDIYPNWSPDGQRIVFTSVKLLDRPIFVGGRPILGNLDIWVMDADGGNPRNLTDHDARDSTPDWSPDGQQIAFSSDRGGNLEVYVMNADGTNPINLTKHLAEDSNPSWAPDGTRIAFDSDRDGNSEIYVMDADGANPINLTNNPAWDSGPSWGPAPTLNVSPKRKLTTTWGKLKAPN